MKQLSLSLKPEPEVEAKYVGELSHWVAIDLEWPIV